MPARLLEQTGNESMHSPLVPGKGAGPTLWVKVNGHISEFEVLQGFDMDASSRLLFP